MGIPLAQREHGGGQHGPTDAPCPHAWLHPMGCRQEGTGQARNAPLIPQLCKGVAFLCSLVPPQRGTAVSPCRWLLPPQALNAYYLPNKNQMGEALPGPSPGSPPWDRGCGEGLRWGPQCRVPW